MKHDNDDFSELINQIRAERNALLENIQHNPRDESITHILNLYYCVI